MRKIFLLVFCFAMLITGCSYTGDYVEYKDDIEEINSSIGNNQKEKVVLDKEIIFKDIPWGTSYTEVDRILPELNMMSMNGESFRTFSTDEIVLGDYQGIDFEYNDINIVGICSNDEIEVAGYTTSDVSLYFAYIPVDGILTKTENDSALYGAQYVFIPQNLDEMSNDLIEKLSSVYGEPCERINDKDMWDNEYEYVYWYGQNNTELVMKIVNTQNDTTGVYENEIVLSYVWRDGDKLLQQASDILKQEEIRKEEEVYGNDSVEGL